MGGTGSTKLGCSPHSSCAAGLLCKLTGFGEQVHRNTGMFVENINPPPLQPNSTMTGRQPIPKTQIEARAAWIFPVQVRLSHVTRTPEMHKREPNEDPKEKRKRNAQKAQKTMCPNWWPTGGFGSLQRVSSSFPKRPHWNPESRQTPESAMGIFQICLRKTSMKNCLDLTSTLWVCPLLNIHTNSGRTTGKTPPTSQSGKRQNATSR